MVDQQTINEVREGFGKIETMDPDSPRYAKLCEILDEASDEALRQMYDAKIRFVSALALNRMIRRGIA